MKKILLFFVTIFTVSFAYAQYGEPHSHSREKNSKPIFEESELSKTPCITEQQRLAIKLTLSENIKALKLDSSNNSLNERKSMIPSFGWPLRQAAGFNDPGYYIVTNFVDNNPSTGSASFNQYSSTNLDYNCGNRTYDTNNGYNHQGTDIATYPFAWKKMDDNAVEVIAADAGVIIGKDNGNFDKNCSCAGSWNAVYIRHSDNSQAWYGHLKNGSLTSKSIGQSVAKGEYLGVVGSSGCSTGPHLHFEVYDNLNVIIDPFGGNCNARNGSTSWFTNQPSYRNPQINKVMTHSALPSQYFNCPSDRDVINLLNNFTNCSNVLYTIHASDYTPNSIINVRLEKPNGTVADSYNISDASSYNAAMWYGTYNVPCQGPNGTWKLKITYGSQIVTHSFNVSGAPLPIELVDINAKQQGSSNILSWLTAVETQNKGFNVEKSLDGENWQILGFVKSKGSNSTYQYNDQNPYSLAYYRLNQIDVDGKNEFSKIVSVQRIDKSSCAVNPNPATNNVNLTFSNEEKGNITVTDALGRIVFLKNIDKKNENASIQWNTENIARGFYFVSFNLDNSLVTKKIVLR
jgi:murein DD-endopeptidase MepM/ murein hydrolase activator NlpD